MANLTLTVETLQKDGDIKLKFEKGFGNDILTLQGNINESKGVFGDFNEFISFLMRLKKGKNKTIIHGDEFKVVFIH